MTKASFSEKPDKIRYKITSKGEADIWLRANIEEVQDSEGMTYYTADENYFRVKQSKMPLQYVEDNFEKLLHYEPEDIDYKKVDLEQRVADLEAIIAELLGGTLANNGESGDSE